MKRRRRILPYANPSTPVDSDRAWEVLDQPTGAPRPAYWFVMRLFVIFAFILMWIAIAIHAMSR